MGGSYFVPWRQGKTLFGMKTLPTSITFYDSRFLKIVTREPSYFSQIIGLVSMSNKQNACLFYFYTKANTLITFKVMGSFDVEVSSFFT